jgi:outer membrane protein OmpA-like peptidoglycan-associated protein
VGAFANVCPPKTSELKATKGHAPGEYAFSGEKKMRAIGSVVAVSLAICFSSPFVSGAAGQVPQGLRQSSPVVCSDDDVVISGRYIETDGIAIQIRPGCGDVSIVNSHIVAGNIGVDISGNGDVVIQNSHIEGGRVALAVSGNGDIEYGGSTFRGGIQITGSGELTDLGGNDVDRFGQGQAAGAGTGTSSSPSQPARVTLGPGGIRIQDAEGGRARVTGGRVRTENERQGQVVVGPSGVRTRSAEGEVGVTPGGMTATTPTSTVSVGGGYLRVQSANASVTGNWRQGDGRYSAADTAQILIDLGAREENGTISLNLAGDVLFDFDRADVRRDAAAQLSRVAHVLRHRATGEVIIEGHTDSVGDPNYNLALSERRAVAVMHWLNAYENVPANLMKGRGLGASKPIAHNTMPDGSDDPAGRARNRRVEIRFAAAR